jgi:hypothetical protein
MPFVDNSNAVEMRARQVRFPHKFTTEPNPRKKREKLADLNLESRCKDLAYAVQFLKMGLENLKVLQEVRKRKIEEDDLQSVPLVPVPKQVQAATAAYVKKNNCIQDFIDECLMRDRSGCIAKKRMTSEFMKWRSGYKLDSHLLKWDWADLEAALAEWGLIWKKTNGVPGFHGFVVKDDVDRHTEKRYEKKQRGKSIEPASSESSDDSARSGAGPSSPKRRRTEREEEYDSDDEGLNPRNHR